jgi:hypothetical protein
MNDGQICSSRALVNGKLGSSAAWWDDKFTSLKLLRTSDAFRATLTAAIKLFKSNVAGWSVPDNDKSQYVHNTYEPRHQ